jgi:hypothetical protein
MFHGIIDNDARWISNRCYYLNKTLGKCYNLSFGLSLDWKFLEMELQKFKRTLVQAYLFENFFGIRKKRSLITLEAILQIGESGCSNVADDLLRKNKTK